MTLDPIRKPKPVPGRTARQAGTGATKGSSKGSSKGASSGFWEALEVRQLLSAAASIATPAISLEYVNPAKKGAAVAVQGYTPAQIKSAYGFTGISETGAGQTIAIVDAYNDPNITSDLGTFDSEFGLAAPPSLQIVSQTGSTTALPATDAGWAQEISLDVEWAHAIAPGANILLVEASSDSTTNLLKAVNYARNASGVSVVSMSWGGGEYDGETSDDKYFTTPGGHTGVTFVAAAGDEGADGGAEWPASSPDVVAVGGTTLTLTGSTYTSESAWSDTSDGTSQYESTPSYQASLGVTGRTTSDVSYDADPNTGFPTYDSLSYEGEVGWAETGGTSAGTPQWAGIVALADQGRVSAGKGTLDGATGTLPALYGIYSNATVYADDFNDITTGSNGSTFGGGGGLGGGGFGGGGFGGGGFGGGGFGGGGFGGGFGGGGFGGGGVGGGFGGHHRGQFNRNSYWLGLEGDESSTATTTSSGVSLTSAAVGYDGPTGLGTPKVDGLVDSLIDFGSATASAKVVKKAENPETIGADIVRFRPAVVQNPAPTAPLFAAATATSSATQATNLNRPEPQVELDTAVGLARPSTSTAATADLDAAGSQAAIGSMSGFLTETQTEVILAKVASALKPIAQSTAAIALAVAAEARQAAGEMGGQIAASTAPFLLAPQPVVAMANIDASATFGDAMTSLTDELATIPRVVKANHSNARAWAITGCVIAADAILLARYRLKRAVFNSQIRIAN